MKRAILRWSTLLALPLRVIVIVIVISLGAGLGGCTPQGDPGIGADGFFDDFERERLGDEYDSTGGAWRITDGTLKIRGARNHPLWLRRTLPMDVRIEFDASSDVAEGDIKVEIFGDGVSHATAASYTATSYVIILGGWNNTINAIARLDEHGSDRVEGEPMTIVPRRKYHVVIERRGSKLTVSLDGEPLMEFDDRSPLRGIGHDHFGFNNWQTPLTFDNLRITPL